jgi:Holliday junction resolvase RusA-like endonuclease
MNRFGVGCYAKLYTLSSDKQMLHLVFPGMLPLYEQQGLKEFRGDCIREVNKALQQEEIKVNFPKAFIYTLHFFPDLIRRDLDNRNRKYLLDCLRHNRLIYDDNWQNIIVMEAGYLDRTFARVEMFVSDCDDVLEVIHYVHTFCIRTKRSNHYQKIERKDITF